MSGLAITILMLCLSYAILLYMGVNGFVGLQVSLGVRKRRGEDVTHLHLSPSPKLEPMLDTLSRLGFVRLGEIGLKVPWHSIQYERVFCSPDHSIIAEATEIMPNMVQFSTTFHDGAVVETVYPMGENINTTDFVSHTITSNVETAYQHHCQLISESSKKHSDPVRMPTIAELLQWEIVYRERYALRKFRRSIGTQFSGVFWLVLGLALTALTILKIDHSLISRDEVSLRLSLLWQELIPIAWVSYLTAPIAVWSGQKEPDPSSVNSKRHTWQGFKLFLALIAAVALLIIPHSSRAMQRNYYQGIEALNMGNNEKAIAYANLVVEYLPDYAPAYTLRGLAHQRLYMFDQAFDDFEHAIRLEVYDASGFYNRGLAHDTLGFYDLAIQDFTKAINLQPDESQPYYARGTTYRNMGDYTNALEDISEAIRLNPLDAEAFYGRSLTYFEMGNYTHALTDINEGLKLDPLYANAYSFRGRINEARGDVEEAIANYSRAIEIDPINAEEAYYARGLIFYSRGYLDQSISDYSEAIRISPTYSPDYYYARGRAYYDQGNYDTALSDIDFATKYEPTNAVYYYFRGLIYAAQNDYEEAIKDYTQAIHLDPTFENAYFARALSYQAYKYTYEAVQDFQTILHMTSDADRIREIQEHLEELGFPP